MTSPSSEGAVPETQSQRSELANSRIRDTAKWLIGAFAAVGAALLAGIQLSSLGRLPACVGSAGCGRLWGALFGLLLGLAGVGAAVWLAASVMTRPSRSEQQLNEEYKDEGSELRRYFDANPVYLQGFNDIDDLVSHETDAYSKFDALSVRFAEATDDEQKRLLEELNEADSDLADVLSRSEAVVSLANQISFSTYFRRRALRGIMGSALGVAMGLAIFAWAANPEGSVAPTAALSGTSLSGADLSEANLTNLAMKGVDFSNAKLTNATLEGANVTGSTFDGVVWGNTTCPDGSNSDDDGGTCLNHLELPPLD